MTVLQQKCLTFWFMPQWYLKLFWGEPCSYFHSMFRGILSFLKYVTGRFKVLRLLKTTWKARLLFEKYLDLLEQETRGKCPNSCMLLFSFRSLKTKMSKMFVSFKGIKILAPCPAADLSLSTTDGVKHPVKQTHELHENNKKNANQTRQIWRWHEIS